MQVIPIETVEQAWNEVFAIGSIAEFEKLLSKMQEKHPTFSHSCMRVGRTCSGE